MNRALIFTLAALITAMVLLVLTALWPSRVYAQEYPSDLRAGDDAITLRPSSEGHAAELFYQNSHPPGTSFGRFYVQLGDVKLEVHLVPGVQDYERVVITPLDHNVIALPDRADVMDGEAFIFQLVRPMF